jgi:glycine betaine/proline transport system substrate-binding protein
LGNQLKRSALFYAILALIYIRVSYAQSEFQKSDPIIIVQSNWTSQIVLSHILKQLLSAQDYLVELKEQTVEQQWISLIKGTSHVQLEIWQGTMEQMFKRTLKSGKVTDMGTHDAITREDWWYPTYVEKLCPGLPDWKALKKCSSLFKTKNSKGKGLYLGGPWEKPDKARIRALELDFTIKRVTKGDDLWVELEKAYKDKKPILLFNWSPNWIESKYEGKFINFPDYDPKCETDPKWGVNKKWTYDCGNPKEAWLKKLAWSGMKEKWPCAFKIIKNLNMTNKMIAIATSYVDVDKLSYQDAAKAWLESNQETWSNWIPKNCKETK